LGVSKERSITGQQSREIYPLLAEVVLFAFSTHSVGRGIPC
jgi:hypothetical protein